MAVLLAMIFWFVWDHLSLSSINNTESASSSEARTHRQIYYGPRNSVAVIPFRNASPELEQEALSEGFSSELLKLLTLVSDLQVTARNSSFYFRDGIQGVQTIGQRLQSAHLLLGDYERTAGRIRINARLVKTKDERELWAESFDRALDDTLVIQDEILVAVLDAMKISYDDDLPRTTPIDPRAWDSYLMGEYFRQQRSVEMLQKAEKAYLDTLELTPEFGPALFGLAEVSLSAYLHNADPEYSLDHARSELDRALQTSPETAEAWGLLAYVRRRFDRDWPGAEQAASHAVELIPGNAALQAGASLALFTLGRFEEAESLLQESVKRDPLNLSLRFRLGLLYEFMGNYEQSLAAFRQVASLNPEYPGVYAYRARVKVLQEKPESALRESESEKDGFWKVYSRLLALSALGWNDEAEALLQGLKNDHQQEAAFQIAEILAFRGEVDESFKWLQLARQQQDGALAELTGNRFLQNLHADPRWRDFLVLLGYQLD